MDPGARPDARPGQGWRAEGHANGRRRRAVRAVRSRRPRLPQSRRRHRRLDAQHPDGLRRPESRVAPQRIAARGRTERHRHAGRPRRRARRARQEDRQDGVDDEGTERCGGLLVGHRRRRAGRAHDHHADLPGGGRCARRRRQADVALYESRQRHGEHHHARVLRRPRVRHVRLQHGRARCCSSAARTARSGPTRSTSRAR